MTSAQYRAVLAFQYCTVIAGSLFCVIYLALTRGQDINWDQLNYHIGIPALRAAGRFWSSIDPAGVQSYYNPYLLDAQLAGIRHLSPRAFTIVVSIGQSIAFILAGAICILVSQPKPLAVDAPGGRRTASYWTGIVTGLLGFALCLMTPIELSEAGTVLTDLQTSAFVIAAYGLLLMRGRWLGLLTSAALAGALIGVATALKLTNATFAFGVLGFALAGTDTMKQRLGWLTACGTCAMLAFLIVDGRWQWDLWQRFGNPLFPFYNDIFRSPDYPATRWQDARFSPHSLLDIWHYPLYWLLGGSPSTATGSPSSELLMRDARWIVTVCGGTAFLAGLVALPGWRRRQLREPETGLLLAVLITYLIWLAEFGIHRYLSAADILCGAAILVLLTRIPFRAAQILMLGAIAIISGRVMLVPDWVHLPWRSSWQTISPTPIMQTRHPIVFLGVKPLLFVAASLPADATYVGVYGDFDLHAGAPNSLARQLDHLLAATPASPLVEVDDGKVSTVLAETLTGYGLATMTQTCRPFSIANAAYRLCSVGHR